MFTRGYVDAREVDTVGDYVIKTRNFPNVDSSTIIVYVGDSSEELEDNGFTPSYCSYDNSISLDW